MYSFFLYFFDNTACTNANCESCPPCIPPSQKTLQAVSDNISEDSDRINEMNKLKKEVERLLCENSALRKEIARLKDKQLPDKGEEGLCVSLSCSV